MAITYIKRNLTTDLILIVLGSLVFAIGLDCFEVPNGLAAGGAAGLATILSELTFRVHGFRPPIGMMVLAMNALLLVPVYRSGGLRYAARTLVGIGASAVFTDLLAPTLPVLGDGDLLLCAIWGGVICGFGVGLIFRAGGNTGGTDVLAQFVARRTSVTVGMASMVADMSVVCLSVLVFGLDRALYAAVCLFIGSKVVDMVVDGGNARRAAYVISHSPDAIEDLVRRELGIKCTRIMAEQGRRRNVTPVLLVVLGRSELGLLRSIVLDTDPHANMIVTSVNETFGEAFSSR